MIRQHFYPKSFYRHRSLSKNQCKTDVNIMQNLQNRIPKEIECNQIRFIKKKFPHNVRHQENSFQFETFSTEGQQKSCIKMKPSNLKQQNFTQNQITTQLCEVNVLRQIHNRLNRQNSLQKQKLLQNDIKNLFIKSDRKQLVKSSKKNFRIVQHQNFENQSFIVDNQWIHGEKRKKSMRKLSTADASRCYKRSIQRKKKHQNPPAEIIINSTLSTLQTRQMSHSQRRKDPNFDKVTDNMINLNLSKAIKYRKSGTQDQNLRQRKGSQKISIQNIQNRRNDFQQKVRGWQIQVEDDIDFS